MANDDNIEEKKVMLRKFSWIYFIIIFVLVIIFFRAVSISTFGGSAYREAGRRSDDSCEVLPHRGNILDCNGKLLSSTLPTYKLYMDFGADGLTPEIFNSKVDSLSRALSSFFRDRSAGDFKRQLVAGYRSRKHWVKIHDRVLTYTEKKQISTFPLYNLGANKSGLCWDERITRVRPFGRLAARTIGSIFADAKRGGYVGIERSRNSVLAGVPGYATIEKIAGRRMKLNQKEPENGMDVVSTIDIDMQDIVENALNRRICDVDARAACAVLMEVKTGRVKAIANLTRVGDERGHYTESDNIALRSLSEPGSTFKTASVMVALDGGQIDTSDVFDTGYGEWRRNDWVMKDHNVEYDENGNLTNKGGYGKISVAQAMWYSSNIGIAKMVDTLYGRHPRDFVNRLYDMKLNEPMNLEIPGAAKPNIPNPDSPTWSGSSLLWMSFGYGVQIPPIYTLAFYNGIANDGNMIEPIFVQGIAKNGSVRETFSSRSINGHLCSHSTLEKVHKMLEDVVAKGTGRPFASKKIKFAGKTGTAQTNYWKSDGKGEKTHQYSFCGYFPASNPQYSCIVVVAEPSFRGYNPAGLTFHDIAERIGARYLETLKAKADTAANSKLPVSKNGNVEATIKVLRKLDIDYVKSGDPNGKWARTIASSTTDNVDVRRTVVSMNTVPNVIGMGAKDAVYLLESRGLRVKLSGYGSVSSQSVPPFSRISKGQTVFLQLK